MTVDEQTKLQEIWSILDGISEKACEIDKAKTCLYQIVQFCIDEEKAKKKPKYSPILFANMSHDIYNLVIIATDYIEAYEQASSKIEHIMDVIAKSRGLR